jgi:hypothetical protein
VRFAEVCGDQRVEFGRRTEPVVPPVLHEPEIEDVAEARHAADVNGFGSGVMVLRRAQMNLVKFTLEDNVIFINPDFVVSVKKGIKDTSIQTTSEKYAVKESVELVVRLLGAEEVARDITPALPKSIDL